MTDISIVLCGEAGQGVQTIEKAMTKILKMEGYNVFATKEYMSRVRGGNNSTEIRVSSERVMAYVDRMDVLIPLNKDGIKHLEKRISKDTLIIGEKELFETDKKIWDVPLSKLAKEAGGSIYVNTIAIGMVTSFFDIKFDSLCKYLKEFFATKTEDIVEKNIEAAKIGYEKGLEIVKKGKLKINIERNDYSMDEILVNGNEAVALGAIAGGCKYICSYPMSPSTGVLHFLAKNKQKFDIVVEQAEDEIAAINAGLGAWYAGARSIVTTSGGGFALMSEGLSLAGVMELPIVAHISQRPGPATGLPTRTEQGDLNLALYAGHGEFPRLIITPGNMKDAFELTQKAFNLAEKYQIPVIILTDQFFVDSYYNAPKFDLDKIKNEKYIVKTDKDYKRYKLTPNGISPMGIPGYGDGLVAADSHEHDEKGSISEDLELRVKMNDKRLNRIELLKEDCISPELVGDKSYDTLVIGWGSTYGAIKEAIKDIKKTAFLYNKQVYPLPVEFEQYLKKAKQIIVVENNATGQFSDLILKETGIKVDHEILKYSGIPFGVEELKEKIENMISGGEK